MLQSGVGCSLCAVIMWFTCYQEVMTSDKFLYLFGKPFPGTSLLITMTLRFIPQLQQNRREIRQSQAMLQEEGTRLLQRLGSALRNLSVLLTMSMEAAVETADSMKSRGYGAKRRTTFHLFRFDGRDARRWASFWQWQGFASLPAPSVTGTWSSIPP